MPIASATPSIAALQDASALSSSSMPRRLRSHEIASV